MKFATALLVLLCLTGTSFAASAPPLAAKAPAAAAKPKPVAAGPAAAQKPKPKPAAPTLRTDVELTGLTSETTNQLYGRISHNRTARMHRYFVRIGYNGTETKSYTTKRIYTTDVTTLTLDTQYRKDARRAYTFVSANANIRLRNPPTVQYPRKSGYWMTMAGAGRRLTPQIEGELGLADITSYDGDDGNRIVPACTLRFKSDLTEDILFDGEAFFVQPFSSDVLVDSRANLTYKFTPAVSLRLTYIANNLLTPVTTATGWDKSLRLSIVFSSTKI